MKLAEFVKVAQMLAKEHKITVEEGQSWAANIKKREVFYRKEDIYNLSEEHILGLLLHEVAHIHYTSDTKKPAKNEELMHSTMNMLEDIAIEHIISGDYPNAGEILDQTRTECLDTLVKMLPKMNKVSIHEKSLLYAATRFDGRGYEFNLSDYEKIGNTIATLMKKRKKEIYERKATKDLIPLATDIIDILLKEAGEPTEKEKERMREQGMHGKAEKKSEQGTSKDQLIKGLKAGQGWKESISINKNITFVDEIADQAARIGKQLRTVLKRNNSMEFGGRYRTGKLMAKRFVRVRALKDRRPFARRIVKSNQSYAFAIASDVSGSMFSGSREAGWSNADYALSSMHMVGEALRLAGVPRSLIIFGDNAITVAKMGKAQIPWHQINETKAMGKAETGGTNIGKAMEKCITELEKIRAERKIMIVLTDGSSERYRMIEAKGKADKMGIEAIGITLGDTGSYSAREMDTIFGESNNTKIQNSQDTKEIGTAFINILKTSIKNSP